MLDRRASGAKGYVGRGASSAHDREDFAGVGVRHCRDRSARRAAIRPAQTGAPERTVAWMLGRGDLLVMGRHGIPKVAAAGPRMAVMVRPIWGS
jgi:hypothetical protein